MGDVRHRRADLPRWPGHDRPRHDAHAPVDEAPWPGLDGLRALSPAVGGLRDARQARRRQYAARLRVPRSPAQASRRGRASPGRRGRARRRLPRDDRVRVHGDVRLRRRAKGAGRSRRGRQRRRGAFPRPCPGDRQGPRRRGNGRRRLRAGRVRRHARDRPLPDGDGVRRRHLRRPSVLGVSVLRRRGRAQRPADELPPVAPAPGAQRPPLPVRVRLGDYRRLPGGADARRRLARRRDGPIARRAGRRLHVPVRDRGGARDGEGRVGGQAARALRVRGFRGAGLGGDRDPRGDRPRDPDVRPRRGGGDGVASVTYDARGLVEPDPTVPRISEIDDGRAVFDAKDLTTRAINNELRWLLHEEGVRDITVLNPGARHSLAVGLLLRCRITFEGSLGYFGCGLIDGPEIHVKGRVGWSACENMMSGVVTIDSNAGSLTGAAMRGGDLIVHGRVGARTGIDQKGGTIVVLGHAASMTGFMMQRGRQILCGDVGPGLGDSMYDGTIYVAGTVKSLGIDCVPGEWTDADTELIERKFRIHGLGTPPEFQKFVCGKKLYNYDTLEPAERKLVL